MTAKTFTAHFFSDTGEAYDACQCDDALSANGQTLLILSEGVVGLSGAWPVAVTVEAGKLHSMNDDADPTADDGYDVFTADQCRAAVSLAVECGYEIALAFKPYMPAPRGWTEVEADA